MLPAMLAFVQLAPFWRECATALLDLAEPRGVSAVCAIGTLSRSTPVLMSQTRSSKAPYCGTSVLYMLESAR